MDEGIPLTGHFLPRRGGIEVGSFCHLLCACVMGMRVYADGSFFVKSYRSYSSCRQALLTLAVQSISVFLPAHAQDAPCQLDVGCLQRPTISSSLPHPRYRATQRLYRRLGLISLSSGQDRWMSLHHRWVDQGRWMSNTIQPGWGSNRSGWGSNFEV